MQSLHSLVNSLSLWWFWLGSKTCRIHRWLRSPVTRNSRVYQSQGVVEFTSWVIKIWWQERCKQWQKHLVYPSQNTWCTFMEDCRLKRTNKIKKKHFNSMQENYTSFNNLFEFPKNFFCNKFQIVDSVACIIQIFEIGGSFCRSLALTFNLIFDLQNIPMMKYRSWQHSISCQFTQFLKEKMSISPQTPWAIYPK